MRLLCEECVSVYLCSLNDFMVLCINLSYWSLCGEPSLFLELRWVRHSHKLWLWRMVIGSESRCGNCDWSRGTVTVSSDISLMQSHHTEHAIDWIEYHVETSVRRKQNLGLLNQLDPWKEHNERLEKRNKAKVDGALSQGQHGTLTYKENQSWNEWYSHDWKSGKLFSKK